MPLFASERGTLPPWRELPANSGRGRGAVLTPAAVRGDLDGAFERVGFANESVDGGAVLENDGADRERRGDFVDELAERGRVERPHFDVDAAAFEVRRADETRLGGDGGRKGVQAIVTRRLARAHQPAVA